MSSVSEILDKILEIIIQVLMIVAYLFAIAGMIVFIWVWYKILTM